ncbi:riboflavin synthase [Nocardiopsis composta]|uniref:Riboflavin synthase n=1 Tax=Nocardiopsis composta TaxID=157465 RepID=A0A7W8QSH0_9ACTN|nr:riboflavin synthase [Nocardiopsis composta]MBB5435757.1 riboflavin synthase [Nocardiopsis composta]
MFTGIVEELGEVAEITPFSDAHGESARITVHGPLVTSDAAHGDSIAVNGVCLTVTGASGGAFSADVMKETLDRSSLGALRPGSPVNLERAAKVSDRLGGHIVQGHVDGTAELVERIPAQRWETLRFSLPGHLARYVAEKGSIAVDGVSLTVASVEDAAFTVSLIPTTLELTTLGRTAAGGTVNLEVDVIAKYVERIAAVGAAGAAADPAAGRGRA